MKYLKELIKEKGHKLVRYDEAKEDHVYMTVINYSTMHGGTYDSFKYNDYVVEIR